MQSFVVFALAFVSLPCDGHRAQRIAKRQVHQNGQPSAVAQPTHSQWNKRLSALLFALSGPALRPRDTRFGNALERAREPRLDGTATENKVPLSFEEYQARRAEFSESAKAPDSPSEPSVSPDVMSGRMAEHIARQAKAREAMEEAARVTQATVSRANELAARIQQASVDVAPNGVDTQSAVPEQIDEFVGVVEPYSATNDNQRVQEKSLPELLSEEISLPTPPSLDARYARVYLPLLGISGLAAGSYYYDQTIAPESAPKIAPEPAPKIAPEPAPKIAVPPPVAKTAEVAPVVEKAPLAIDPIAEAALMKFFPGALESKAMDDKVAAVLGKRGYTKANTLFANSMCPDEVNADAGDLADLMKTRWGESFALGGLAGLPFVGKAGFSAYAHHAPDNGKLLVMFAPHVGIDFDGKVGKLKRLNQKGVSTACGAAIGAYNGIMKEALEADAGALPSASKKSAMSRNDFDGQIEYIKAKLRPRLQGIEAAPDEIAFVTYQMYAIAREFLIDQVLTAADVFRDAGELCVVGGIMVNFGNGGDRFMPLFFQSKQGEKGEVVDLYKEAFGDRPDLSYVLADKAKAQSFYKYDLSLSVSTESKMQKLFPGALDSSTMDSKVAQTLTKYGYTKKNTLFATSTCPDEVNTKQGELLELMKSRWGENFALGGLAGVPFVGKSGFGAYAHHVPDDGKLFIMFAPHVGIDFDGKVGALKRLSQKGVSTACGAAIGAYNGIIKEALDTDTKKSSGNSDNSALSKTGDAFDAQIEYIKAKLRERLDGIDKAPDQIAFVTYQMYAIVREFVDDVLAASNLFEDANEVCILGGIQVNGESGDHFMPLIFESKKGRTATTNDLYVETFGYRPDLTYVLGSEGMARSFYKTDMKALS